ncbi:MAG: zinc ribbon domain-containing protein, partial [Planctomycetota bacterium]|nr:zinc ribbon domain-containing protein [Planctomycetota bacterium]
LEESEAEVGRHVEVQDTLLASMDVARETMQEMTGLHRLSIEQGIAPSAERESALAEAQARFIAAQGAFEKANARIGDLNAEAYRVSGDLEDARELIGEQRTPADDAYSQALDEHRLAVAAWKLGFIVPIFALASWLFTRSRDSRHRPIFLAFMLASFLNLGLVMHDTFPEEYFKYIAICAGIIAVLAFLARVLGSAAQPQPALLLKRRRESYFKSQCPECAYPFPSERGDTFFCPACGSGLFESCGSCSASRHRLLPHCQTCGAAG